MSESEVAASTSAPLLNFAPSLSNAENCSVYNTHHNSIKNLIL